MAVASATCDGRTITKDLPVFEGTLIYVQELHNYMRKDWNLYGFLHKFPSVSREQALEEMERAARETARRIIECGQDGALVFERTDVAVKYLFDYLADGQALKDFHWDFPSVFVEDTHDAVVTSGRILEVCAYRGLAQDIVSSDRAVVSGAPVFTRTRLPIRIFFDYLANGETLKDFHYSYPSATPEQLIAVVNAAGKALEREFNETVPV